jgi:hypothetical protein
MEGLFKVGVLGLSASVLFTHTRDPGEVARSPLCRLFPPTLAQRYSGGRAGDQIVSEGKCGFEKFNGSLCAALGKFDSGDDGVRFVDEIAERVQIKFAVCGWHDSSVLANVSTSKRLLKAANADLGHYPRAAHHAILPTVC